MTKYSCCAYLTSILACLSELKLNYTIMNSTSEVRTGWCCVCEREVVSGGGSHERLLAEPPLSFPPFATEERLPPPIQQSVKTDGQGINPTHGEEKVSLSYLLDGGVSPIHSRQIERYNQIGVSQTAETKPTNPGLMLEAGWLITSPTSRRDAITATNIRLCMMLLKICASIKAEVSTWAFQVADH